LYLLAGLKDAGKVFETAFIGLPGPGRNTCLSRVEFDAQSEKSDKFIEVLG
jgi:hypothetical protein